MAESVGIINVGDRVQIAGHRAIVRYVGSVKGQTGEWVGVEWDDLSRGKHNGETGGERYFVTANGATSGSFVRKEKIRPGKSIVYAVEERYKKLRGVDKENDEAGGMFVQATRNKMKKIEFVGRDQVQSRQAQTQLLTAVDLTGESVACLGVKGQLGMLIPNLEELDLSSNLISNWVVIAQTVQQLPKLQVLNLSRNRLSLDPSSDWSLPNLKTLILNECNLSWEEAVQIVAHSPDLKGLQLCGNSILDLEISEEGHRHLNHIEVLDLENNKIGDWEVVWKLHSLACLSRLNMNRNPIKKVQYQCTTDGQAFGNLECLLLGDCAIDSWISVDALNQFPKLRESRLTGNPLVGTSIGGRRFEIIARVQQLSFLNGGVVSIVERIDSERRYLGHVAAELLAVQQESDRSDMLQSHPRYDQLIAKHGHISASSCSLSENRKLKDDVVEIKLTCVAASAGKRMGSHTKKVPLSMTLGSLKALAEKLFKLPKQELSLFLKTDGAPIPEPLNDEDTLQLSYLGLQAGQEILVEES